MPSVLYPPSRPQAIGEVLDSAFRIFKATLLKSLPYSVLATVAGQLQNIYVIVTGRDLRPFSNSDPGYWAVYVLGAVLGAAFYQRNHDPAGRACFGHRVDGTDGVDAGTEKCPGRRG